ncbi:MAG: hypothetical protein QG671_2652, partial [Actinomycetota bacterium]|nr:hypothetical protein [Actinomycetota bacterium]
MVGTGGGVIGEYRGANRRRDPR